MLKIRQEQVEALRLDRDHCAAQKVGTDTDIVPLSVTALGMPTAATMAQHFDLTELLTDPRDASATFESQNGHIVVYAAGVLPARDVV